MKPMQIIVLSLQGTHLFDYSVSLSASVCTVANRCKTVDLVGEGDGE